MNNCLICHVHQMSEREILNMWKKKMFPVHAMKPCRGELNRMLLGFEPLPGPMHLGLRTGRLCPMLCADLKASCSFSTVPDGPYS